LIQTRVISNKRCGGSKSTKKTVLPFPKAMFVEIGIPNFTEKKGPVLEGADSVFERGVDPSHLLQVKEEAGGKWGNHGLLGRGVKRKETGFYRKMCLNWFQGEKIIGSG